MGERAGLHVCVHVYLRYLEAFVLEHADDGDYVWVNLTPRERLDGCVDDVGTIVAHLQDGSH